MAVLPPSKSKPSPTSPTNNDKPKTPEELTMGGTTVATTNIKRGTKKITAVYHYTLVYTTPTAPLERRVFHAAARTQAEAESMLAIYLGGEAYNLTDWAIEARDIYALTEGYPG